MAPIKFEDDFKEKLDKRTIAPSTDAWEKLSKRLDNQEESNTRKSYWWFGVAASIIGVLFIVSQLLNDDVNIDEPTVVETPEQITESETITIAADNNEVIEMEEKSMLLNENKDIQKEVVEQNQSIKQENKNEPIVLAYEKELVQEKVKSKKEIDITSKELTFEEQKIQDVVAKVQLMKAENNMVTDADIEVLLLAAQKEIQLNRLNNETTGVVDANALLQDVEAELDQSFRTKIFDALKSSYNSVKTAVAQRNN